jgi:predicted metal-binding membrane protein
MSRGGFRSDPFAALRLGAEHGAYCVGCCWVLMTLLFVGGIMNVLWIAGLTILILLEKVVPMGRRREACPLPRQKPRAARISRRSQPTPPSKFCGGRPSRVGGTI